MSHLASLDAAQEFAADLLRQLVQDQILDKAASAQQLEAKNQEIADLNGQVIKLQSDMSHERQLFDIRLQDRKDDAEHERQVMATLVSDVEGLQTQCGSGRCDCTFDKLWLERKGDTARGRGEGEWLIRCRRCRCRLNE